MKDEHRESEARNSEEITERLIQLHSLKYERIELMINLPRQR